MDTPLVSIVIVTYGRLELLRCCINSIEAALGARSHELIVIVNQDEHKLPDSSLLWLVEKPSVILKRVTPQYSGAARNEAIPLANGEWICFLDDDVQVRGDYFDIADQTRENFPSAGVFGGPDSTNENATTFQNSVSIAYASYFCMGSTNRRHSRIGQAYQNADERFFILCNLWIRSTLLKPGVYKFPSELNRNEENVLLAELYAAGAQMVYQPDLVVLHERKKSFRELWQPIFRSGYNRFKSFFLDTSNVSLTFFVPMLFVYYLLALVVRPNLMLSAPLLLYVVLNFLFSFVVAKKAKHISHVPLAMAITFFVHVAYGLGSIAGSMGELRSRCIGAISGRQA